MQNLVKFFNRWSTHHIVHVYLEIMLVNTHKQKTKIALVYFQFWINSIMLGFFFWPLQTIWTQIRTYKMSGLTWFQTVWHSEHFPEK